MCKNTQYTTLPEKEREIGVFVTFKYWIGSYVIYWFQLYTCVYIDCSHPNYIFKGSLLYYKINEDFCT